MRRTSTLLVFATAALASLAAFSQENPPPPPPPALVQAAPADHAAPGAPGDHAVSDDAAIVYLADDGGLNFQAVRAIYGLAVSALRKRGISIVDDSRTLGTLSPESARKLMRELHIEHGYAIEVQGRLGNKVPLAIQEVEVERPAPLFSASLTASSLEECDIVIPRLVNAVVDRRAPEDNATMASVTNQEARPFKKRPGEVHWSFGLTIPTFSGNDSSGSPFGLSTQLFYEVEHFNFGVEGLFGTNHGLTAGGLFFQANWIPIDGEVSPYLGAGIGYMGADSNGGLGFKVQAGIEALRLHQVRILAGFEALIPAFDTSQSLIDGTSNGDASRHVLPMFFLQFSL